MNSSTDAVTAVPFLDLKLHTRRIWSEVRPAMEEVIEHSQFVLGPAVERFEAAFARYVGARYCVGLNNGTSALHMAMAACGIGIGDEVITTPHSWISTSWAISYAGALPVFVDVDPATFTIDPELVRRAVTPRTRAIVPVHLYGQACRMDALERIARNCGLALIEDAAQAHGAEYHGRRVGTFGQAGCFSFYPGKNLGAFGEAGALVTDDEAFAARVRRLRDHAQDGRHHHVELGYNARMEGLQGAVLEAKLRHLDDWNAARIRHARRYRELLAGVPGIVLPAEREPGSHVWHLFVILVQDMDRRRFQEILAEEGVATAVHYPTPIPFQPAYAALGYRPGDFPVAEEVMSRCVSLPMYPELTDDQIHHVAAVVRDALAVAAA